MLSKTKKIALLTTGLVGALVTSSAVGVALSSCTTNSTSTEVEDNTKYNTYINWSDPSTLSNLVVDENGLVYSDIYKTTVIAVTPSFTGTTITVPASVRSITGYTEVLPSGATIVRGAFQPTASFTPDGGTAQSGVTLNNLISTVKFAPNSQLKSIGAYAFYGCTLLQSIDLPTTVTMIGNSAFYGCTLLGAINLTNVEYVGSYAFTNLATSLVNPTISISLNKAAVIGNNAFENASITSVDFSANTTLISMGNYAFNGCSSLTGTVDLSKATSLTSTGTNTFQNCSGITAVNLPSSLRIIGESAFSGCSSIANTIDLSGANKLSTIGANAFNGCTKLTGLSYPVSAPITSFGQSAFSGCSALTQLGTVAGAFTAPATLTSIAANTFSGTSITTVNISNMTVANPFVASSLAGMTSLTSVNLGTSITTLPANLFAGDTALKTITLPASITSVVTNPTDSSAVTTANGYSAFYGSSLETVDMSAITSYNTTENMGTTVPAYLFAGLTSLKNVILKTGTTVIGANAFQGTSGLTSVREASQNNSSGFITTGTLTSIGNNAFEGTGLTSFIVTAINNSTEENRATTNFTLGNYAFQNATKLESIDLSNATGLTTIPQFAFGGTTALTSIKFPTVESGATLTLAEGAFSGVTSLTEVNLSAYSNLSIAVNNFINANSLTSIDLSGLTSIPDFISSSNSAVFTGLPQGSIVKLSSAINTITNQMVFTQVQTEGSTENTRVSLQYPKGIIFTSSGESPQISSTGLLSNVATLLNNVSGPLDLSSNTSLISMGTSTLFGNTGITSLTLSASGIVAGTNLYTLADGLDPATPPAEASINTRATATNSDYVTTNVPLGNNSALTSINFNNFKLTPNVVGPGGLLQETFTAIAKIMNSYACYSVGNTFNFKNWTNTDTWIQDDTTLTYTPYADSANTNKGGKVTFDSNITVTDESDSQINAADGFSFTTGTSKTYKLTHNSIKWNLVYNADAESITLTTDPTTPANIYKGVSGSNNLQVYIKTNSEGNIDTTGIQIAMSIKLVKASS